MSFLQPHKLINTSATQTSSRLSPWSWSRISWSIRPRSWTAHNGTRSYKHIPQKISAWGSAVFMEPVDIRWTLISQCFVFCFSDIPSTYKVSELFSAMTWVSARRFKLSPFCLQSWVNTEMFATSTGVTTMSLICKMKRRIGKGEFCRLPMLHGLRV